MNEASRNEFHRELDKHFKQLALLDPSSQNSPEPKRKKDSGDHRVHTGAANNREHITTKDYQEHRTTTDNRGYRGADSDDYRERPVKSATTTPAVAVPTGELCISFRALS